jgi:hypothetical protein
MLIGSDDTLTVWLNGKTVYDYQGNRPHSPAADRVEVSLAAGVNRVIVKCGNNNGEWKFSLAVTPPPESDRPITDRDAGEIARQEPTFEQMRDALPAFAVAARSSLDRFQQKLDGQTPADDLAALLAADERDVQTHEMEAPSGDAAPRAELAAEERRIANALRNLETPDAILAKSEAILRADQAARALEAEVKGDKESKAREAVNRAGVAADALARRLRDEPSARERIDEIARIQNVVAGPDDPALGVTPADRDDAAGLARRQRHIREELQAILGDGTRVQQALRERSVALGREAAALRERSREISPRAHGPADAANDLFRRAAPEAMARAEVGLQQGRPGEAVPAQRYAADLAEQAARHVEDLAAALRADRPTLAAGPADGGLAVARSAVRTASERLARARSSSPSPIESSKATQAAAEAMHRAARGLRATSRPSRGQTQAREPGTTDRKPRGAIVDRGEPELQGLKAALRAQTGRSWGELPGHLRNEILQMSEARYRDDYARLIELYFRELAADASERGTRP